MALCLYVLYVCFGSGRRACLISEREFYASAARAHALALERKCAVRVRDIWVVFMRWRARSLARVHAC